MRKLERIELDRVGWKGTVRSGRGWFGKLKYGLVKNGKGTVEIESMDLKRKRMANTITIHE